MSYIEEKIGNFRMRIKSGEGGIHSNLRKIAKRGGEREPELLYLLRKELTEGMVCMDLGANIGYITLLMAEKVGPSGKIYAVEPDPSNVKLLKDNIRINNYEDRVKFFHMGISNVKGEVDFYVGKSSNLSSMTKSKNTRGAPIKVKVDTLSNFCKEYGYPELIKMDVEGHEVEVLEGMYDIINNENFPCKIVMELHPTFYSEEHSLERWMKKFLKCGFETKYVISAAVEVPDKFKEWGYKPIKSFVNKRALYDDFLDRNMLIACCHQNKQWMPHKKKDSPKIARFVMIGRE